MNKMINIKKAIYNFIVEQYYPNGICNRVKIKQFYEINRVINFLLNIKKRNCFTVKVIKSDSTTEDLFAVEKKHHNSSGPEYKILTTHWLRHYNKNSKFKIPRPISWIPENKILITEKSEGVLLSKIVMFCLFPGIYLFLRNYLNIKLMLSVDWLIDFQNYTEEAESFDFTNLYNEIKYKFEYLSPDWKEFVKPVFYKIDYEHLKSIELPRVDWHGDFLHRNILIKNKTITVIDWEGHWKFDSLHPLFELYRFIFNIFYLSKLKPIYSLRKIKRTSHLILNYYIKQKNYNINLEKYRTLYYSFIIFMIYCYDKQVSGLSLTKSKKNSKLLKTILHIDFEYIFYDK